MSFRKSHRGIAVGMLSAIGLSLCSCGGSNDAAVQPAEITAISQPAVGSVANSAPNTSSVGTRAAPQPRAVLVKVASTQGVAQLARDNAALILESDPEDGWYRLRVPDPFTPEQFALAISRDPRVASVEIDQPLTPPETGGERMYGDPIHLAFDRTATTITSFLAIVPGDGINETAYQQVDLLNTLSITRGAGVTVAVLDTGVMASHPNLKNNLVPGYNVLNPKALPSDVADGVVNASWGHGTMVAGVIARLAPGAKIMPIRVLDGDGQGSVLAIAKGVRYAVEHGARVLNLSLGGSRQNGVLMQVIQSANQAGVVVVAAAGNYGTNTPRYPAGYPNVIGVAAAAADDTIAPFSTYGSDVALVAPGVGIRSTYVNGGYATWSGTSFSAPFVSATAALILSAQPSLPGSIVTQRLLTTGRSLDGRNPAYVGKIGHGMLDIARATGINNTGP